LPLAAWTPRVAGTSRPSHADRGRGCPAFLPLYVQFFNFGKKKEPAPTQKVVRPTVVPAPSFNVPLGLLAISGFSAFEGATPFAVLTGLLGVFLTVQATRVK
jgi:hypothetical protein